MINLGVHAWHDYVAKAAERLSAPPVYGAAQHSQDSDTSHTGGVSFQQAIKMAVEGWPEGATKIAKALDSLPPSSESLPDWIMDVTGSICNVPAFVAGEPECMWNLTDNRRDERRLTLVVQASYGFWVSSEVAMNYAIALAANVRSLEASGINTSVVILAHRRHPADPDGVRSAYGVFVREYGEPLDLAKIAFAFHPAFLRRVDMAWRERNERATTAGINNGSYGRPVPYDSAVVREVFAEDIGQVAVIRGISELGVTNVISMKATTSVGRFIELIRDDISRAVKSIS